MWVGGDGWGRGFVGIWGWVGGGLEWGGGVGVGGRGDQLPTVELEHAGTICLAIQ